MPAAVEAMVQNTDGKNVSLKAQPIIFEPACRVPALVPRTLSRGAAGTSTRLATQTGNGRAKSRFVLTSDATTRGRGRGAGRFL